MVRVGVNGFGRIGRNVLRAALERNLDIEFVAVNDLTDAATLAYLLKYDSVHHTIPNEVGHTASSITVDGKELRVFSSPDPAEIPWGDLGVEIVVESSGRFTSKDKASRHLRKSVEHVIISVAVEGRRRHDLHRRQRKGSRSGSASDHLERLVHDQLPGTGGQGAAREVPHRDGDHDDDPFVHERSGDPRSAAQRRTARPRRGDVDDPDDDRRGKSGRPRAAGAEGEVRRNLRPGAHTECLARRPDVPHRTSHQPRGDQSGAARRRERRA